MFVHDRILDEKDICNFKKEIQALLRQVEVGGCIRLYGLRNFGKTSILRNVIGARWQGRDQKKRIFLYVDLFSVQSLDDISVELLLAFNKAMSSKLSVLEKTKEWMSLLKNLRPTWTPDLGGLGEFSFKTASDQKIPDFSLILENIDALQRAKKFEFCLVFDEFQEVAKIPKSEAKLRGALQSLPAAIPVIISGSKPHLLRKIFENPRAPFYTWGNTVELGYIDYQRYFEYIAQRFSDSGKEIEYDVACYIQDSMFRIPESINRICEYIRIDPSISQVTREIFEAKLVEFLDLSRSNFEAKLAALPAREKIVVLRIAAAKKSRSVLNSAFLQQVGLSKSSVSLIVNRLMDQSVIYRLQDSHGEWFYQLSDPLLSAYIERSKLLH